jgi:O-antigen/teichoic acid export membrane protein
MKPEASKSLLTASALLATSMVVAGGANYILNVGLTRMLDPGAFGDASLMLTWMLALTSVGVGFQLVTVRATAGVKDPATIATLRRQLLRTAVVVGFMIGALLIVAANTLHDWFHTSSASPFVIFALGVPGFLGLAVDRGLRQARGEFGRLAASYLAEAATRVTAGLGLVGLGWGADGATWGITLSFYVSWALARRHDARVPRPTTSRRLPAPYGVGSVGVLLVGQLIINNGDVLLAKAKFTPDDAGLYLAVAIVGRAVFFGSWAITQVVFPAAVRQGNGADAGLLRNALMLVGAMAAVSAGLLFVAGSPLSSILFGPAYRDAAPLLGPYALAAGLFAMANLVATVDLARHRTLTSWIVLGAGVTQMTLIAVFATTAASMVWIQVGAMAGALLVILVVRPAARDIDQTLTQQEKGLESQFVSSFSSEK